jgi:hypothetical protein
MEGASPELADQRLYRLLALVDALRGGRARKQRLAAQLLKGELGLEVPAYWRSDPAAQDVRPDVPIGSALRS